MGVLRFEGPDAQSFLQGQLTNNVAALDNVHSQYSGYCTPKGRLLAVMLLWRHGDTYAMLLPRELCEPLCKRLSMYILRAKVRAADVSAEQDLFGVCGPPAPEVMAALAGAAPGAPFQTTHGENATIIKLPENRFLIVAVPSASGKIEAQLGAAAPGAAESLWTALDIQAGIPTVVAATQEQFVPQAVNFDLIGAVRFDKGCYPGQEIVARAHYLGKVKQRMVRARLASRETPAAGDKLFSAAFGDQASGMIVSSVNSGQDRHEVLAVIQSTDIDQSTVHWKSPQGVVLQQMPLPYPVT